MSQPLQRPIVLLVEDSDDDVFFFRHALKKSGADCVLHHAPDGGAAIAYLEATLENPGDPKHPRPDLVFLDLKVPTFSGFEILSWIRQHRFVPELDVAILSGSEHASDLARATDLGASAYFVKPISTEQLRAQLARAEKSRQPATALEATRAPA